MVKDKFDPRCSQLDYPEGMLFGLRVLLSFGDLMLADARRIVWTSDRR
jgi:hypothetical protein